MIAAWIHLKVPDEENKILDLSKIENAFPAISLHIIGNLFQKQPP